MSQELQAAFEESLDRVQRGEASLDQVLRDYPELAADLRELLVVALDLQAMTPPPMTPAEMARGLTLIDQELQRRAAAPPRPITSFWDRLIPRLPPLAPVRLAGVVAAVAVALVAYGGVTLAAVNSGPGSALYGYRLSLEELRVAFVSEDERAILYLEHAEARLREIEQTAPAGDRTAVQHAIDAYRDSLRKGVSALSIASAAAGPADREDAAAVVADFRSRLRDHQTRLQGLTEASAPDVRDPIAVASQSADEGLLDARRGPNLALLPTATPGVVAESAELPTPSPASAATAAAAPPPPTAAPTPSPAPTAPTQAAPTATPAAESPTPSREPTETPPEATPPADAVVAAEQQSVLVGRLDAQDDARLLVSGIAVRLPGADEPAAQVDLAIAIGDWVQVVAVLDSDGQLRLVNLGHAPTPEPTETPEPTASPTPEATATPVPTETPAPTESPTPEATPTPEPTASPTPEATATPEPTATPEATATPEPTETPTPEATPTPEPTETPAPTETPTPEATPTPEPTETPVPTESPTPEATPSPEPTETPAPTETPTPEPTATPEPTESPTPEATPEPTETPAPTESPTPEPTETPAPTETPVPETTPTPEPTVSPEPTPDADGSAVEVDRLPTLRGIVQSVEGTVLRVGGVEFRIPDEPADLVPDGVEPGAVVRVAYRVDATDLDDPLLLVVMVELIAPATQDAAEAGSAPLPPPAG